MSLGMGELFLILVIVFVLFGAGKLPQVMGDIGKSVKSLKRGLKDEEKEEKEKNSTQKIINSEKNSDQNQIPKKIKFIADSLALLGCSNSTLNKFSTAKFNMTEEHQIITTQVIEDVVNKSSSDRIAIRDLVEAMDGIGFGLAIMVFAFGIIIPLPPPFPSIISMPLVIFSLQMILGYTSPKLPKRFSNLSVKRSTLAMLVKRSSPYIRKVERILKPRLSFMTSPISEKIVGVFILIFSTFILLPMPLSNFVPGLGILIISFGLLGKDGLIILLGITVGVIGVSISITAVLLGVEALTYLKHLFF